MSKAFVVVGMHRSGTSLVSSMLHAAGVQMCHYGCKPEDKTQPYGYWEDVLFTHINRLILKDAGGSWVDIPDEEKLMDAAKAQTDSVLGLIREVVTENTSWGFKDPRTSVLLPAWMRFFEKAGVTSRFIWVYRNQQDVINSLTSRNGDKAVWQDVVAIYEDRLLNFFADNHVDYIDVDFDDLVTGEHIPETSRLCDFIDRPEKHMAMTQMIRRRV